VYKYLACFLLAISISNLSFAEDKTAADDFGNMPQELQKIYDQMTPEQRIEIMKQAEVVRKKLEAMTPQEREKLEKDAMGALKTIDTSKIDVKKIDTSKGKDLEGIQSDIKEYQKTNPEKVKK
jgi:hypothetical protein